MSYHSLSSMFISRISTINDTFWRLQQGLFRAESLPLVLLEFWGDPQLPASSCLWAPTSDANPAWSYGKSPFLTGNIHNFYRFNSYVSLPECTQYIPDHQTTKNKAPECLLERWVQRPTKEKSSQNDRFFELQAGASWVDNLVFK